MIRDWMVSGAIAGVMGGICQNIYAGLLNIWGMPGSYYIEYGKVLLFARNPSGLLPDGLGLLAHFAWDIILAIVFVCIIQQTSQRYFLLKGLLYGMIVWFLIRAGATLFKIPIINQDLPHTIALFFIGSLLFGVVIVNTLRFLQKRQSAI
jgi:hypothetical protein